ncbi:hypothetical protein MES5069_510049 [Mesorhizobium escarrei]|uniref:Uncharacterized protein n=2 Tax=Mesorhizobium escarrei TaxID=666018 RepID=A0ABM9EBH0_9HYPH|nr:hypothetical protein MES5069_510049 [Mesorhizobium escarrei]
MIKADTPFALMLDMHAVVLGVPALILLSSAAIVALIRPWHFSYRSAWLANWLQELASWLSQLCSHREHFFSALARLEDPRYRSHFVCKPYF